MDRTTKEQFEAACQRCYKDNGLPEPFQSAAFRLAWSYGHSSGYDEVLVYLEDICDEFGAALKKYEEPTHD